MPDPPWKRKPREPTLFRMEPDCQEYVGVVERVVFSADDGRFQVVRFRPEKRDETVTLAGELPGVVAGEPIRARGAWKTHREHGPTFEVESYVPILPRDPEVVKAYLGSGLVKGVGPVNARKLVDHFGEDTLDVLENDAERLREAPGIGPKRARSIAQAWREHRAAHEVMLFLAKYEIPPALCRRLMRHYGDKAASVLRSNPYRVGLEVHGIGFLTADKIAGRLGVARDSAERLAAGLVHLLVKASDDGHTWAAREDLLADAVELLGAPAGAVETALDSALADGQRLRQATLPEGQVAVFMRSLYTAETGLARLMVQLMNGARPIRPQGGVAARLEGFETRTTLSLAPQQRDAVHSMLEGGVSVVTGGPGTGKTTLVRALLHAVQLEDFKIALCSPTGRAAQRLAETTGRTAMTIHRLLKYNAETRSFTYGTDQPLPVDLLIVDEASMLDVPLAYALLSAVRPGAAVVFVGDIDQLPSVGAGNFLRDLIDSRRVRTTRLSVIFRQAQQSAIVVNAHRINAGEMPVAPEIRRGQPPPDFFRLDRRDPAAVRDGLVLMIKERAPRRFGLDPIRDIQVLTPMRRGDLGTVELNELLQAELNGDSPGTRIGHTFYRVGDKVIQGSNNYDLEVFNGDVGRIESIDQGSQTLRVRYGGRSVEYLWDEAMDQLQLAYAITIHKSQGSEYPAVMVVLHTQHYIMLRRNLLYTGLTRGKRLAVLLGPNRAIATAVRNASAGERRSALGQWLVRPPATEGTR